MADKENVKAERPQFNEVKSEVVKLTKSELLKDKENSLTVPEQAKKYGLPVTQMRKALSIAGITTKAKPKARKPQFEIVEEQNNA